MLKSRPNVNNFPPGSGYRKQENGKKKLHDEVRFQQGFRGVLQRKIL